MAIQFQGWEASICRTKSENRRRSQTRTRRLSVNPTRNRRQSPNMSIRHRATCERHRHQIQTATTNPNRRSPRSNARCLNMGRGLAGHCVRVLLRKCLHAMPISRNGSPMRARRARCRWVLSADEVARFLEAVPSLKTRTPLTTAYAAAFAPPSHTRPSRQGRQGPLRDAVAQLLSLA